jgi:hypothetical protein
MRPIPLDPRMICFEQSSHIVRWRQTQNNALVRRSVVKLRTTAGMIALVLGSAQRYGVNCVASDLAKPSEDFQVDPAPHRARH